MVHFSDASARLQRPQGATEPVPARNRRSPWPLPLIPRVNVGRLSAERRIDSPEGAERPTDRRNLRRLWTTNEIITVGAMCVSAAQRSRRTCSARLP
jgi:hypothetical protein